MGVLKKNQPGKNIVLLTGFILAQVALGLLLIAFMTPYWVISWPRVFSEFKRIGLWEACFAGLVLEWDPSQKAYHGCWWTLAEEYIPIREWMMPPWFVTTQVLVTICLCLEVVLVSFLGMLYSNAKRADAMGQVGQVRQPFQIVQASMIVSIIVALSMAFTTMLFACCFYWDKNWMPRKDLNYLSWSYGLALLSTFFNIFACIPIGIYNRITRTEYRYQQTPQRAPLNLSMVSSSSKA